MRTDLLFKFPYTFEVWTNTVSQDPLTGSLTYTYAFDRNAEGLMITGSSGNIYLATREVVPIYAAIRSFWDMDGNRPFSINGTQYDMYVIESIPQYDAFAHGIGFKATLNRKLPTAAGQVVHTA